MMLTKGKKMGIFASDSQISSKAEVEALKYEMPDGRIIEVGNERFRCPEALFQPFLFGHDANGVHKLVLECIKKSDSEIQKELSGNRASYEKIII